MSQSSSPSVEKQTTRPVLKVVVGCIIVVIVICLCVGTVMVIGTMGLRGIGQQIVEDYEENTGSQDTPSEDSPAQDDEIWDRSYEIGDVVELGGIEWTVLEAEDAGSTLPRKAVYNDDCVASSGTFIYVKLKARNTNNTYPETTANMILYDEQKNDYSLTMASKLFHCVDLSNELLVNKYLSPGVDGEYLAYYEVPTDASGFKIRITDLKISVEEYEYIDLGF